MTPNSYLSLKSRFASKFVKSLVRIKNKQPDSSPDDSTDVVWKKSQKIKLAAYSSMAHAVGTRRAWSRALIFKIRNRAIHRHLSRKKPVIRSRRKGMVSRNSKLSRREPGRLNELRGLVPGGEAMDLCSLLEETTHFVKCLSTQVKVMQSIVDHYSS